MNKAVTDFVLATDVPLASGCPMHTKRILRDVLAEYHHGGAASPEEVHPEMTIESMCWVATQMVFEIASGDTTWLRPLLSEPCQAVYDDLTLCLENWE